MAVINKAEGSLTARVMGTSSRVAGADTRVTEGTDGRVPVVDASMMEANGRVIGVNAQVTEANGRVVVVDGRATRTGGRVEGVTVSDPISLFMMTA